MSKGSGWNPRRVWVTKDGQHLRIRKMTSDHIRNCIRLLKRHEANALGAMYSFASTLLGEMAQDAMDSAIQSVEDGYASADPKCGDFIESFEYELLRRGEEW